MPRLSLDSQIYPGSSGFSPESDRHFWAFGANQYRTLLAGGFLTKDQLAPLWATFPAWVKPSAPPPSAPLSAPPAPQPCAPPTPPELTLQLISTPVPARSYPPPPSVETIEEVEHIQVYKSLRNIKQMRQKLRAQKMPRSETPSFGNCIGWSPKIGGIDMRFSRDEDLDAWYTTVLNHTQSSHQELHRIGPSAMRLDATIFIAQILRFGPTFIRSSLGPLEP